MKRSPMSLMRSLLQRMDHTQHLDLCTEVLLTKKKQMPSRITLCLPRLLINSANQAREQERTSEDYLLLDPEGGLLSAFTRLLGVIVDS
ncbi:MAG: hypothetical protein E6J34_08370 [Chloroflexi bacterium]|nr:MAG: hypothetical protein E6J34_08370 [Chloroflexota bacterium]